MAHRSNIEHFTDIPVPPIRVGLQIRGQTGMKVERPNGSGDYVIVRFLEPVSLDRSGLLQASAGECVIWTPDHPSFIAAGADGIYNDYVHLTTSLAEGPFARFQLPVGHPFPLSEGNTFTRLLERLQEEWIGQAPLWEAALTVATEELFLFLARAVLATEGGNNANTSLHDAELREVRRRVHEKLDHPWTVPDMARLIKLRPYRFTTLYGALFHRSPIDDLIQARIQLACFYLKNHPLTLTEIAVRCGFTNVYHFSRSFRRLVGVPPGEYRLKR